MCGIAGIYQPHGKVDPDLLRQMTAILAHRGPDGAGHWVANPPRCGLGHRRLNIVGISDGAQPIATADGNLAISANGEFYGDRELRRQLIGKGHHFKTESDSEIALHLYREHGLDFVHYLRGEFAFLLWDAAANRLIAVRDRFGIKPLYYSETSDGTVFLASEAKALFAAGIASGWNETSLYHAMCFQYTPLEDTLFAGIRQLPPASMLIATPDGIRISRYWQPEFPTAAATMDETEAGEMVLAALKESIGIRLRSDNVPLCAHVSGGIDSAAIAGIGSELYGKPIPCFTVTFPHDLYDEGKLAQDVAERIGADFHAIEVNDQAMVDALPDAVYFTESLAINNHLAAKFILNQEIRKAGFKIALTGEGSDEIFLGYPHLVQDYQQCSAAELSAANAVSTGIQISDGQTLPLGALERKLGFVPGFMRAKSAIGYQLHGILDEDYRAQSSPDAMYHSIAESLQASGWPTASERVYQSSFAWMQYALAGYILRTLGDGCEMAHGVEGRVPFLDPKVLAVANRIPTSLKIHHGREKYILREAVRPYVPEAIYQRKKHPFMAPPLGILKSKKGWDFLQDTLRASPLHIIDRQKLSALLDELPHASTARQIAMEPVLMLMLTATLLARSYHL